MPNGVKCFYEIYKTRVDFVVVLVDVFINDGVDVVCSLMLWCKSSLTAAQDFMLTEEVLQSMLSLRCCRITSPGCC